MMGFKNNIGVIVWIAVVAVAMVIMQFVVGDFPVEIFRFPVNILALVLWLTLLGVLYKQRTTSPLMRFMLSSRSLWLTFTLIAGVGIWLGLERKPSSDAWVVVASMLYILSHLIIITLRGWRNARGIRWRFTLLHLGLIFALGAGFWGAPDREQLRIAIDSKPNDQAYTMAGEPCILDYTLTLEDYDIRHDAKGMPEHYEAQIGIDNEHHTIRVNHPYARSWQEKIYLISFGRSTTGETYCILEIVREPWQWLSMAGILMLIAGAVMMFLGGPRIRR
ncbi:MAG: cytochrome c biogenesis protein ResB [Alistipes sp.]|nr:cytochrome c biogenesis protein ResB [Alistipes sp.]